MPDGRLPAQDPVLFFDGLCNLCDRSLQWVIRNDRKERFFFASLQSEAGRNMLAFMAAKGIRADSVVLWQGGQVYVRSEAAIRTGALLGGWGRLLGLGRLLPRSWRDAVYDWVARNRYRWFGTKQSCMLPAPGLQKRFLT